MVELELITLSIITTLELEPLFSRLALIGEKNLPQFYAKYSNWRFTGSVFFGTETTHYSSNASWLFGTVSKSKNDYYALKTLSFISSTYEIYCRYKPVSDFSRQWPTTRVRDFYQKSYQLAEKSWISCLKDTESHQNANYSRLIHEGHAFLTISLIKISCEKAVHLTLFCTTDF